MKTIGGVLVLQLDLVDRIQGEGVNAQESFW